MLPTIAMLLVLSAGNGRPGPIAPAPDSGALAPHPATLSKATAQPLGELHDAQVMRRVYDLRHLTPILSERESFELVADTLFGQIAHSTDFFPLLSDIFIVDATNAEHGQVDEAIRTLQALHTEGYIVRVELIEGGIGETARVGRPRPEWSQTATIAVVEQFALRTAPTTIADTNQIDYIAQWSPVVSDNAVGYDPQIRSIEDGLSGTLTVGVGSAAPGHVNVQLQGGVRTADLVETVASAPGAGVICELPVFMARASTRVIDLRASIPFGQPTVIGVLRGFGLEAQIAVVVEVTVPK